MAQFSELRHNYLGSGAVCVNLRHMAMERMPGQVRQTDTTPLDCPVAGPDPASKIVTVVYSCGNQNYRNRTQCRMGESMMIIKFQRATIILIFLNEIESVN